MFEITPQIKIRESELQFAFVRGSGPGGQNINKVATTVQLRFDVQKSNLPEDIKRRLILLGGRRVSGDGVFLIEASKYRSQEKNREEAIHRLVILIRKASIRPRVRKNTRPTAVSKEKRLKEKKQRGETKRNRRIARFD